jgi:hypothetical protein
MMTPEEMLHELNEFARRVAAATAVQELDAIISDARTKLAPCGQSDHDILNRLSEVVTPHTEDMRRPHGQESAGAAPTKANEMRFHTFAKLQKLKK